VRRALSSETRSVENRMKAARNAGPPDAVFTDKRVPNEEYLLGQRL